jgi:hypothetical protein
MIKAALLEHKHSIGAACGAAPMKNRRLGFGFSEAV